MKDLCSYRSNPACRLYGSHPEKHEPRSYRSYRSGIYQPCLSDRDHAVGTDRTDHPSERCARFLSGSCPALLVAKQQNSMNADVLQDLYSYRSNPACRLYGSQPEKHELRSYRSYRSGIYQPCLSDLDHAVGTDHTDHPSERCARFFSVPVRRL